MSKHQESEARLQDIQVRWDSIGFISLWHFESLMIQTVSC